MTSLVTNFRFTVSLNDRLMILYRHEKRKEKQNLATFRIPHGLREDTNTPIPEMRLTDGLLLTCAFRVIVSPNALFRLQYPHARQFGTRYGHIPLLPGRKTIPQKL